MSLADIKNYLRIDADITDDDELLLSLIDAAKTYIEEQTGRKYADAGTDAGLYDVAIRLLVANWYDNRQIDGGKLITEYSHSVTAIIRHLAMSTPVSGGGNSA